MESKRFPEVLKQAIARSGMRQAPLAKAAGTVQGYVSDLVNGKKEPSEPMVRALAEALGADVDEFLLAAGFAPERLDLARRPVLAVLEGLGPLQHPPTADEERVMMKADAGGVDIPDLRSREFWTRPPAKRRRLFQAFEMMVDELADLDGEDDRAEQAQGRGSK